MKRPMLLSGITVIIVLALLIFTESGVIVIPVLTALVLFLYFLFRKKLKKHIYIPTACIVALVTLFSFFLYNKCNISPVSELDKTSTAIAGKVTSSPRKVSNALLFNMRADRIGDNNSDTMLHIILYTYSDIEVELYDYLVLKNSYITIPRDDYGKYDFTEFADNIILTAEAQSFEKLWTCEKTPYYYCLKLREAVTEKTNTYMTTDNGALLKGMLFGEKSELSYKTTSDFRNGGISHLLAVSGLHTSLWCGLLIAILSALKLPDKTRSIICLIFLVLFCIISGFTPSVMRASFMTAVALTAPFFKRTPDSINSLGFAVTVILLNNPYILLSISFQLSASATLGVLMAGSFDSRINKSVNKLPLKTLRAPLASLALSLLISFFAGLFTMPVSVYYFEVFSLASPISNLLCVQLAFYGMMTGTIAVALSFIPLTFIKEIYLFIFKITGFILGSVKELASFVSGFKFCTIPVHKDFLHISIIIAIVCFIAGFIIYSFTKSRKAIGLIAVICAVSVITAIALPLTSPAYSNTITVSYCDDGIQLVVRSGTSYAYIENTTAEISDYTLDALPKATCEQLEYYIPTYLSKSSVSNIDTISVNYSPQNITMPVTVREIALRNSIDIPRNTYIDNSGVFTLSDEITIEIVDTSYIKYAIIRGASKTVFVHLYGDTDFSKYISVESCDIAVYNGSIPDTVVRNAQAIIISTEDYDPIEIKRLSDQCASVYTTAKHGSVQMYI